MLRILTVDKIIKSFTKMKENLNLVIDRETNNITMNKDVIQISKDAIDVSKFEMERAKKIQKNIDSIVGV